ncbi:MAG TPA: pyrrolo-quinoline quinone, partial [Verrucomicrobiae bacterium]|nr:pyrrolo-quinoline quinone [Verrucomicrobiae bacterium]
MNLKIATVFLMTAAFAHAGDDANWPSFRGWRASGVAEGIKTAEKWDAPKGENVKWKTPIPGLGHSGAVVWEDRLFLTTAVKEGEPELKVGLYGDIEPVNEQVAHSWQTFCLDKRNGKVLWKQTAREGIPRVKRHPKSSHANSTPATDGRHVVSFFGSEGLYCHTVEGKLLWNKDLGTLDSGYFRVPTA